MASPLRSAALDTAVAALPAIAVSDPSIHPQEVQQPPPQGLRVPAAVPGQRLRRRWWATMLPAWLRRHHLVPQVSSQHSATFTASAKLQQRLVDQFDLRQDARATPYPLLQAQGVVAQLQARVLADLGVSRRHVLHLRHQTRLPQGARALGDAHRQRLDCLLLRVVCVSPTEVMALLQTRISDDEGRLLALLEDGFVAGNLPPASVALAEDDDLLRRAISRDRRRKPVIDPATNGVLRRQLFMPGQAGRRFGAGPDGLLLQGTSRWPGRRYPAVRDLYLRNLAVRELAEWGLEPASLQITFCIPARIGQTLCLHLQGRVFEIVGPEGQLMAFGNAA